VSTFRPYLKGAGERGRKRDLGIAAGFTVLALLLFNLPDTYRTGLATGVRNTALFPVIAMQGGAADRAGRFGDAGELRAERDSLAAFLVGQANLAQENRELRALMGFRERLGYTFVAAEASRGRGVGATGTLQLSAGRREGVGTAAAIVTAEGLVGSVWRLGDRSAVGIDWTHPEFGLSVMTQDGETYGIAKPTNGPQGERMLALTPVAFHTQPPNGSLIVTSGDGGLYPRGIPVGRVAGAGRAEGGWQRVYYIRPLVSPAQMSHVLILGAPTKAPTDQDLAAAWGVTLSAAERDSARATGPAVSPDAATPTAPVRPQPRATAPRPRPQPRRPAIVDPTPELPGRVVDPNAPRVPPGLPAPTNP
jgi:rod shape-determining protein MreC